MTGVQKFFFEFFNRRGRKVFRELIISLCADDPDMLEHVRLQRVILRTEKYVTELPFFYFFLVKITLFIFQYSFFPFSKKILPFTWLNFDQKQAYMEEWQTSGIYLKRILFKMLTTICVSHLYSEPKLLEFLGYGKSLEHRQSGNCKT